MSINLSIFFYRFLFTFHHFKFIMIKIYKIKGILIMYTELQKSMETVSIFLKELNKMLAVLGKVFSEDNVGLEVPDGYQLPIYKDLVYKFTDEGLTILPLEYARFCEDEFSIYDEIIDTDAFICAIQKGIAEGKELVHVEETIEDFADFIKVTKEKLDSDKEGMLKALSIIKDLKGVV